ncbi:60S ribosomal subunit protein L24, partial [Fasciolopsis buskii]
QEFRFCRGKCHKAFKKHRNPRKVKWTKVARKCRNKELTDDLAQTFEKKRNSLLRYERDALLTTVEAVPKIVAIKQKREAAFIRKRLMKGIENRKAEDIKLVNTQMHLIKAPNAREKATRMDTSSDEEEEEKEEAMDVALSKLEDEVEKEKKSVPKKKTIVKRRQKLLAKA